MKRSVLALVGLLLLISGLLFFLAKERTYYMCEACIKWEGKVVCEKGVDNFIFENKDYAKLEAKKLVCYMIHQAPMGPCFGLSENMFDYSCRGRTKRELPLIWSVH